MDFTTYICPELLVLVPVLFGIGAGAKKSNLADKWIPLLLGGCGVVLSTLWVLGTNWPANGAEAALATFTAITQGILVAAASVYVHQNIKQFGKDE